jgi:acetate---CoA ligase (ADP-forming)
VLRSITGAETDVHRLFNPRSITIVGASSRPGTLSWWPLELLRSSGFSGDVYPINPGRDEIDGVRCYRAVEDLPDTPDLAIVALNAGRSLDAVRQLSDRGVPAAVLPTQGFAEIGEGGSARAEELASLIGPGKLRIVGSNTDGVANLATGAIASIQPLFAERITPGPVAIAAQSGATAGSLMVRLRAEGIGCRLYASAGNETDLGLADYLSVMLQDPEVRIVLSFVESIRRPDDFINVARMAAESGKPIALIKVGRSEQGARRASAHTGALAGSDAAYDTVLRELGVIRVDELSELVAVAKLFLACGRPRSRSVGIMSVSGGQAGAIADKIAQLGLNVPALSPRTERQIDGELEFGTGFNPCDLTGAVASDHTLASRIYRAFSSDGSLDTVIYARKKLTGAAGTTAARELALASAEPEAVPVVVYAMDGAVSGEEAATYREAEIPVFASVHELSTAIRVLSDDAARTLAPPKDGAAAPRLGSGGAVDPATARGVLARYGVPLPAQLRVTTAEAAVAAAAEVGFPVVLKVDDARIAHKTEVGGVVVGLLSEPAVADAAAKLIARVRRAVGFAPDGLLVQEQVPDGVELIAGVVTDPGFGPFVLVGFGGVLAELLSDTALQRAPVSPEEAMAMLRRLRGYRLLDGFRGAARVDIGAAAETIARLSQLAWDHRETLAEVDLNPLVVLGEGNGVRALDVLITEHEVAG